MCGRYTITATPEELMKRFRVKSVEGDYHPLYNAAPTLNLPVITNHHPEKIVQYRWGLIPYFAKNPNEGFKMINARVETLAAKPAFKDSLKRRRCLVLADSFYEWKK